MIGLQRPWETLCNSRESDEAYDNDPTVLEYIAINKENGLQPVTMKTVRGSVGADRDAWRLAMQVEVDSLRENESFAEATSAEPKKLQPRDVLPMKMVLGIKRDVNAQTAKFKARAVVCGNFQEESANGDI